MSDKDHIPAAGAALRDKIDEKLLNAVAADPVTANPKELYKALSLLAREQLSLIHI